MELKNIPFNVFMDLKIFESNGMQIPLTIDFKNSPHMIVSGKSGTGKTYATKLLLASMHKFIPDAELYVCDYKNDEDFYYLTGNERYWGSDDCEQGFEAFYERFEARRKREELDRNFIFLFFDEYISFLEKFQGSDTALKKKGEAIKSKFGAIMRMGRSLGVIIICAVQRADANYFPYGARENFKVRLGLGTLSSDSKTMLFAECKDEMEEEEIGGQGRGYMFIEGKKTVLKPVIVPRFNIDKVNREIELFVQEGCSKVDLIKQE